MTTGTVGVLNVGAGDTKLVFDKKNPADCIRAARIVRDMLRRGYALLISTEADAKGNPIYRRATDFDEDTCEYIIADFDPVEAAAADAKENGDEPAAATAPAGRGEEGEAPSRPRGRPRKNVQRFDASQTRAVAVARSAGG